jgi:ATP synthase F1 subcomplex gamma subunit
VPGSGGVVDRGLCGGYNANVLRRAEELFTLLRNEGKDPVLYVVGRKALGYYSFRQRAVAESWTGFSERPEYTNAKEIADTLVAAFMAGADDEGDGPGADGILGVDELHIVSTEFKSMLSQTAEAVRIAPLAVEYSGRAGRHPDAVLVRAERGRVVRCAAAAVHRDPCLRGTA